MKLIRKIINRKHIKSLSNTIFTASRHSFQLCSRFSFSIFTRFPFSLLSYFELEWSTIRHTCYLKVLIDGFTLTWNGFKHWRYLLNFPSFLVTQNRTFSWQYVEQILSWFSMWDTNESEKHIRSHLLAHIAMYKSQYLYKKHPLSTQDEVQKSISFLLRQRRLYPLVPL